MAKVLGDKDKDKLLNIIEERYIQSLESRKLSTVKGWNEIESRLRRHWSKLWSLSQMETSGGEPRLISVDQGKLLFIDCSEETPAGRRNVAMIAKPWSLAKNINLKLAVLICVK